VKDNHINSPYTNFYHLDTVVATIGGLRTIQEKLKSYQTMELSAVASANDTSSDSSSFQRRMILTLAPFHSSENSPAIRMGAARATNPQARDRLSKPNFRNMEFRFSDRIHLIGPLCFSVILLLGRKIRDPALILAGVDFIVTAYWAKGANTNNTLLPTGQKAFEVRWLRCGRSYMVSNTTSPYLDSLMGSIGHGPRPSKQQTGRRYAAARPLKP
jgi:hypothetical protein